MSLLDKINSNTEKVRAGKSGLVTAIKSKGGSISAAGSVPTFNELINGVNSIDTSSGGGGGSGDIIVETIVSAGNGAINVTGMANDKIKMNDSIKVIRNITYNYNFAGEDILPATAKIDNTPNDLSDNDYSSYTLDYSNFTKAHNFMSRWHQTSQIHGLYMSPSYTVIGAGAASPIAYYFPFLKLNGVYQQLKIDGVYNRFTKITSSAYFQSPIIYDEDKSLLFLKTSNGVSVYKLDKANLNLTLLKDTTLSCSALNHACRGHLFYSSGYDVYVSKYDENTNDFTNKIMLYDASSTYYEPLKVCSFDNNNTLYVLMGDRNIFSIPMITKLTYDVSTDTYSTAISATAASAITSTFANMPDKTRLFYVNRDQTVFGCRHILDNGTAFDITDEDVSALFLDDASAFDPSKISDFVLDNDGYMIAKTGDGGWYMLHTNYDKDGYILGYRVIANVSEDFFPTPTESPRGHGPNINFTKGYFMNDVNVKKLSYGQLTSTNEGQSSEYLIYKTNNILSNEDNLYGFGVAKTDISVGEEGTVSLGVTR